jgi:hypothetical protein
MCAPDGGLVFDVAWLLVSLWPSPAVDGLYGTDAPCGMARERKFPAYTPASGGTQMIEW